MNDFGCDSPMTSGPRTGACADAHHHGPACSRNLPWICEHTEFNSPSKPGNALFAAGFGLGVMAFLAGCIWAVPAFVLFPFRPAKGES
jgi:hypothetical protein